MFDLYVGVLKLGDEDNSLIGLRSKYNLGFRVKHKESKRLSITTRKTKSNDCNRVSKRLVNFGRKINQSRVRQSLEIKIKHKKKKKDEGGERNSKNLLCIDLRVVLDREGF